jgi:hypothetical protein
MTERAVGITIRNPTDYIAAQLAAEQVEGHQRLIQVISITAGKIETGINRSVSEDDSNDTTTLTGDLTVGDSAYLAAYVKHSEATGSCLVTPLLCNSEGAAIGHLPPRYSNVTVPVVSGTTYLSHCLTWEVMATGAYSLYMHVSQLSAGNTIDLNAYTF